MNLRGRLDRIERANPPPDPRLLIQERIADVLARRDARRVAGEPLGDDLEREWAELRREMRDLAAKQGARR
jgi:hypothetical protein